MSSWLDEALFAGSLLDEAARRLHNIDAAQVIEANPARLRRVIAGVWFTRVVSAQVLEEDIVPVDAPVGVAADGVECGEVLEGRALAPRLLADLPDECLLDGLPDLDDAPRDAPLTLARLPAPLDEEELLSPHHDAGDTRNRIFWIFAAQSKKSLYFRLARKRILSFSGTIRVAVKFTRSPEDVVKEILFFFGTLFVAINSILFLLALAIIYNLFCL